MRIEGDNLKEEAGVVPNSYSEGKHLQQLFHEAESNSD